jgi:hypothetical protein
MDRGVLPWLRQYREMAEKYQMGQILMKWVSFHHELTVVRMGYLPPLCSWAELFLFMLQGE